LRNRIDDFREKGFAVFVSECGMTDASGDGRIYEEAFGRWVDYLEENKISWVYWSFSNKDEASAMLKPEYQDGDDLEESLSESGLVLKEFLAPKQ
jgi:endoglucanase